MILNSRYKTGYLFLTVGLILLCMVSACKKNNYVGKDPYADAKPPLDIKVNTTGSDPVEGAIASTVTLSGTGFLKYKTDLVVLFNGEKADVISVTDTEVKAKVPENASTGVITLMIGAQIVPGPKFRVNGSVKIDKTFNSYVGANGSILNITALPDNRMLIVGDFTDYNNAGIRAGYSKLAIISPQGVLDKSFKPGKGIPSGYLNRAALLLDGKVLIGGQFTTYGNKKDKVANIAKISLTGAMDSTIYSFVDKSGEFKKDTVPSFGAFFSGSVSQMMVQSDGNVVVMGSFKYYMTKRYYPNQKDTIITDSVAVNNMVRIRADGSLDKTFNFNTQSNQANSGFNGAIYDSFMQADGKMIVVGGFSSYNGENVNRIVRLNENGTLDKTFNTGAGPSGAVYSVRPYHNQILIAGEFLTFNGKAVAKAAVLNGNGSVDETFNTGISVDGLITKAVPLGNGKILLTGSFQKFNGITRNGFAIVEPTGKLSVNYNTLGGFGGGFGSVNDVLNVDNGTASILVGSFTLFDLLQNNRLVKITY